MLMSLPCLCGWHNLRAARTLNLFRPTFPDRTTSSVVGGLLSGLGRSDGSPTQGGQSGSGQHLPTLTLTLFLGGSTCLFPVELQRPHLILLKHESLLDRETVVTVHCVVVFFGPCTSRGWNYAPSSKDMLKV